MTGYLKAVETTSSEGKAFLPAALNAMNMRFPIKLYCASGEKVNNIVPYIPTASAP